MHCTSLFFLEDDGAAQEVMTSKGFVYIFFKNKF